jgi:hypothetical protein
MCLFLYSLHCLFVSLFIDILLIFISLVSTLLNVNNYPVAESEGVAKDMPHLFRASPNFHGDAALRLPDALEVSRMSHCEHSLTADDTANFRSTKVSAYAR